MSGNSDKKLELLYSEAKKQVQGHIILMQTIANSGNG